MGSWLYQHAGMASPWTVKAAVFAVILVGLSLLPRRVAAVVTAVFALAAWVTVVASIAALASG